jgi:type IV secretion system protein VirB5
MKFRTLIVAALAGAALHANAQMIVSDPKALAEAIKQVRAWQQQYQQMQSQIQAMTGDRGMSRLLPAIAPALPADWSRSMSSLSSLAQQIRQSQAVLTPAQAARLPADLQRYLSQAQNLSAANQAMAQTAYNDAAVRQARLQTLTGALATTKDPKAAYDLANRIAIEHAELVNDQHQLESAGYGAAEQERARRLQVSQMRAASFGTSIPKVDNSLP